ncbi:MAG: Calx-beta domain-containing protein [Saprospiraceae bacterium]
MKNLVLNIFLLLIPFFVYSQNYDIRFNRSSVNCQTGQVCYDVQLRPNGSETFNLAGQNYRIFYNSSLASYVSGTSLLPSQYTGYTLVQDVQDANADAENGPLSFEATLGFLNYTMDLNDTENGGIVLPSGQWTTTSNLCFTVEPEVIDNPNVCLEMVWGRDGLTDGYATAFVEVSRWVSTNFTTNSIGILYDDLDSGDGDGACFNTACVQSSITVGDVTINENEGSATVQVCIGSATTQPVTVTLNTSNGTALAGSDYVAISNALVTIPAGQTCSSVIIPVNDDVLSEGDENFNVTLSNPSSNATIGDGSAVVTILDNEPTPSVSISDGTVNENDGTVSLDVCLTAASSVPTTMILNTSNGTAVASSDYTTISGLNVTIPAGSLCTQVVVSILDDTVAEGTESFSVTLSSISANATFSDPNAQVTILDNEVACNAQAQIISW